MADKKKEGVSVKEVGDFAKKYRFEVFFCIIFIFACLFSLVGYFRAGWSLFFLTGGAILGMIFPVKADALTKRGFQFSFKQDKMVKVILGIVALLLAIFLPFLIFLGVGLIGGRAIHKFALDSLAR